MNRASSIFSTYYSNPARLEVTESTKDRIIVLVHGFIESQKLVMEAIVGWLDGLMT